VTFSSRAGPRFWGLFDELPDEIQELAKKKFALFAENPAHPSLQLKPVGGFWSVRVTEAYRAVASRNGNEFTWVWIGNHDDYERIIK
jgi:hypothetical protein